MKCSASTPVRPLPSAIVIAIAIAAGGFALGTAPAAAAAVGGRGGSAPTTVAVASGGGGAGPFTGIPDDRRSSLLRRKPRHTFAAVFPCVRGRNCAPVRGCETSRAARLRRVRRVEYHRYTDEGIPVRIVCGRREAL